MPTPILIDCDPGHDDAIAILFAARELDLVGITTVHGNAALPQTTRNALALCTLAGLEVPVVAGAAEPLVGARSHAPDIHGESGLDGAVLPEPDRAPLPGHAVDFIIAEAERRRGELVLAGIGPLTNLALALRREPRLASWLKAITIMGGSSTLGNVTPAAEFNVWCDPEAAAIVLGAGVPVWMVGYNLTRQVGFGQADIDRLRGSGRRVATTLADLLQFYLDRQRRLFGLEVAPMHDVCAIVPFAAPGLIVHRPTAVVVELRGEHTRGATVCDLRDKRLAGTGAIRDAAPPNVRFATTAETRALIERVLATLLLYP